MALGTLGSTLGLGFGQNPQQSPYAPYDLEEEQRLIDQYILGKSKGLLQYTAETLDKPGRAARGLLAGKPSELLNLIPFSDTLGLTNPEESVSGRDLLEQYGAIGQNTPGLDWGDVAGFGAEVLLDPTTYMGVGLLTKGGKAAAKAGTLTKGLGKQIAAGERSLLSFGLPFTQGAELGAGSKAVGETVQAGIDAVKQSPVGRGTRALFDWQVGGHYQPMEQAIAEVRSELLPKRKQEISAAYQPLVEEVDALFPKYADELFASGYGIQRPDLRMQFEDYLRNLRETGDHLQQGFTPAFRFQAEQLVDKFGTLRDTLHNEAIEMGARAPELGGSLKHDPRFANRNRPASITAGRRDILKDLPHDVVNKMGLDPQLRTSKGWTRDHALNTVVNRYGQHLNAPDPKSLLTMAESVVDEFAGKPVERIFKNLMTKDTETYLMKWTKRNAQLEATHKVFGENLLPHGGVSVPSAFSQLGLDSEKAIGYLSKQTGLAPDALAKMEIPADVLAAVGAVQKKLTSPEWESRLLGWYDNVMNLWKRYTLAMPATQARNFTGGQFVNATSDLIDSAADLKGYTQSLSKAFRVWKKQGSNLTADELKLLKEMELTGTMKGTILEDMGLGRQVESILPGNQLFGGGFRDTVKLADEWIAQNPSMMDKIPFGVGKAVRKTGEVAAKQGQKAQHLVEWLNRASAFDFARKKGYSFDAAVQKVKQLQFDYSELAPFEQQYMRRLMPFYSFQRFIMPLTFKNLASRPGGPVAQSIRASQQGRQEVGFVPEYIGEGAAIPLSESRYLSSFGLPFEQAFAPGLIAPTATKTIGRTLEKNIAGMAPWISGTYALASGREPFTGRELGELYPYPTDSPAANVLLQRTPYGRTIGAVRTIGDERKGPLTKATELLTGVKVTDVSGGIERQKALEARRILSQMLADSPRVKSYTSYYADPRQAAELTPEETRSLKLLRGMEKRGREHAKKQKLTAQQKLLLTGPKPF